MRAKFINEIKREIEGSGLGPLGVGRAGMFKAYAYFQRFKPDSVSEETIEKFLSEVSQLIDEKKLNNLIKPPYNNYLKIEGLSNEFMGNYIESLDGPHKIEYISLDDDNYYINTFYNTKYNVGFFHEVTSGGSNYIYFVKYK